MDAKFCGLKKVVMKSLFAQKTCMSARMSVHADWLVDKLRSYVTLSSGVICVRPNRVRVYYHRCARMS